jgi:hypothetical protein
MTILETGAAILSAGAVFASALLTVCQVYNLRLARARARENKLDADAEAAVAAVDAEYLMPLRRSKLSRLFTAGLPPGGTVADSSPAVEVLSFAQLYVSWSLELELTPAEAEEASRRALAQLTEDYPDRAASELVGKIHRALAISKKGMPSALDNLSSFVSRVRPNRAA